MNLPIISRQSQSPNLPLESSQIDQTRDHLKKISIYGAIAAVIAAISSGSFLLSDNKDDVKKGEKLAKVYVILEITVVLALVALVALKAIPYFLDRFKK